MRNEIVFGVHSILEVLKAKRRRIISLYTSKPAPLIFKKILKFLPKQHINIQYVNREALSKLAGASEHQGIVALVSPFPTRKKFFDPLKHKFLLLLDGIQDVRNLGGILRSSYCAGVDGVIITKKNSASLNAAVFKSSAGLAEYLEILFVPTAVSAAIKLKQFGYNIYISILKSGAEYADEINYKEPLCLVIGSEAKGISTNIIKFGKHIILPQRKMDISYNVSVASGILLFLLARNIKKI